MTNTRLIALVITVLFLVVLLPVTLSIWLAHYQAQKDFTHTLDDYGERVIQRSQQVADQAKQAIQVISQFQGTPCSDEHLMAMRRIAYTWRDVQEVLWLDGLQPRCSSMEKRSAEIWFPSNFGYTHDGYRVWLTTDNDLGIKHAMVALANEHYMVMVDPTAFVDVLPFSSWNINAALIATRSGHIIAQNADLTPNLWENAHRDGVRTFERKGMMYNLRDYPELGISLVVWASTLPLDESWHRQLLIWLPLGIFISLAGAGLIIWMVRRTQLPWHRTQDAIKNRTLEVYYQPVVSLKTKKIVGAEALARWPQPDGTFLSPDIFIPIAEQAGLITDLTKLVVEKIFEDLGAWLKYHPQLHISVNLDPSDLNSPSFSALLFHKLLEYGISPSQIALELTERSFIDPQRSSARLSQFREAGHAIYIDDFGTGYSSLSFLKDLQVDTLKIDKAFVDPQAFTSLTPHVIEIAKTLNLSMIAEGVETQSQADWLEAHDVQFGQGWLYSKALPKEAFIAWAEANLKQV